MKKPPHPPKILVSACLMGQPARYDGAVIQRIDPLLKKLDCAGRLELFCPELAGGLPLPRPPAEIRGGDGRDVLAGKARIVNTAGEDVTRCFVDGAAQALERVRQQAITIAILKEKSPSCGSRRIYDGTFSRTLIEGEGVCAALLRQNGVRVLAEDEIPEALKYLGNTQD